MKTTILLQNLSDYSIVNKLYSDFFNNNNNNNNNNNVIYPARTTYAVSALPLGALVEIDAVAINNNSK